MLAHCRSDGAYCKWLTCSWHRSLEGRGCYVNVGLKGLDPKMRERGQEDTWSERGKKTQILYIATHCHR